MKDKANVELTARQADIISRLLPTVRISGELAEVMVMAKLKLEVDEIIQIVQKAFRENGQTVEAAPTANEPNKSKRKRH